MLYTLPFIYRYAEHHSCHWISRQMRAFYAIKLPWSVRRWKKNPVVVKLIIQGVYYKTHPKDQTYKYWNKNTRSCPPAAFDAPNIAELPSTGSLSALSFVGHQLRGKSCNRQHDCYWREGVHVLDILYVTGQAWFHSVGTEIVRTEQYGVLYKSPLP